MSQHQLHDMIGVGLKAQEQKKHVLPCSMYKLLQPYTQTVRLGWREQE